MVSTGFFKYIKIMTSAPVLRATSAADGVAWLQIEQILAIPESGAHGFKIQGFLIELLPPCPWASNQLFWAPML